jgi:hypothetical protein
MKWKFRLRQSKKEWQFLSGQQSFQILLKSSAFHVISGIPNNTAVHLLNEILFEFLFDFSYDMAQYLSKSTDARGSTSSCDLVNNEGIKSVIENEDGNIFVLGRNLEGREFLLGYCYSYSEIWEGYSTIDAIGNRMAQENEQKLSLYIAELFVSKVERGNGYGGLLLFKSLQNHLVSIRQRNSAIRKFKSHLIVSSLNQKAVAFYSNFGFRPTNRSSGDEVHDLVLNLNYSCQTLVQSLNWLIRQYSMFSASDDQNCFRRSARKTSSRGKCSSKSHHLPQLSSGKLFSGDCTLCKQSSAPKSALGLDGRSVRRSILLDLIPLQIETAPSDLNVAKVPPRNLKKVSGSHTGLSDSSKRVKNSATHSLQKVKAALGPSIDFVDASDSKLDSLDDCSLSDQKTRGTRDYAPAIRSGSSSGKQIQTMKSIRMRESLFAVSSNSKAVAESAKPIDTIDGASEHHSNETSCLARYPNETCPRDSPGALSSIVSADTSNGCQEQSQEIRNRHVAVTVKNSESVQDPELDTSSGRLQPRPRINSSNTGQILLGAEVSTGDFVLIGRPRGRPRGRPINPNSTRQRLLLLTISRCQDLTKKRVSRKGLRLGRPIDPTSARQKALAASKQGPNQLDHGAIL